jgi:hypothetical protein
VDALDPGPAGPEPAVLDADPGVAVGDQEQRKEDEGHAGEAPGEGGGQGHDERQPQGRDEHDALHPPAQRHAQPLVVRRRLHAPDPFTSTDH